tara:strand:- start:567 stop:2348 length:1782 start_codon:yes stop_codon:yes gene_type:complete
MYKRIKAGQNLRITGKCLYAGADTSAYFNSVSLENEAEIIPDSFNSLGTEMQIKIPEALPNKLNTIIVETEIGQFHGPQQYEFIGQPQINTIAPDPQYWDEVFEINGNYFYNTTGVSIGETKAVEYWAGNRGEKIQVKMPKDVLAGEQEVFVRTEIGETSKSMQVLEPSVFAQLSPESYTDGLQYGESVRLEDGLSLHRVNRVVVSGFNGPINVEYHTRHGSTGITFDLPQAARDEYPLKLQEHHGSFVGGVFQPDIRQEYTTENNVRVTSPYLDNMSARAGKYEDQIQLNGVNLYSCGVFFSGYGLTSVEAPVLSTGETFVNVSVPKNIVEGQIMVSGKSGVYGTHSSNESFYPLPTISSISTTEWTVGGEVQIEAINASQMAEAIGLSGTHSRTYEQGLFFVSNPEGSSDHTANYFGRMNLDNSSLLDSVETGVTKITALINSSFLGNGSPFLIPSQEVTSQGVQTYAQSLVGSTTLDRYHDITGQNIAVVGKQPIVLGVQKTRTTNIDTILVSGRYLISATGLGLSGDGENHVLAKEDWEDFEEARHGFDPKLLVEFGDDANLYESVHIMKADLSKIMFAGRQGSFYFLA